MPSKTALRSANAVPALGVGRPGTRTTAVARQAMRSEPTLVRPTVFHEPWWLDIASDGRWEYVIRRETHATGWMPYLVSKAGPFRNCTMPAFTHFLGPVVHAHPGSAPISFNANVEFTRHLIEALPATSSFRQKFHRDVDHVVPFQMLGFDTSVQFTLEIEPRSDEALWSAIKPRTRGYIRAAEADLTVYDTTTSAEFCEFYVANLQDKGCAPAYDMRIAAKLIDASLDRGRGSLLAARSHSGHLKAAVFCVNDARSSYYLMTTRSRDSGNGANALLIWHAIRRAANAGLTFDFDGFGHQNSVQFYSSFGGSCAPRFTVRRSTMADKVARSLKNSLRFDRNKFTENN